MIVCGAGMGALVYTFPQGLGLFRKLKEFFEEAAGRSSVSVWDELRMILFFIPTPVPGWNFYDFTKSSSTVFCSISRYCDEHAVNYIHPDIIKIQGSFKENRLTFFRCFCLKGGNQLFYIGAFTFWALKLFLFIFWNWYDLDKPVFTFFTHKLICGHAFPPFKRPPHIAGNYYNLWLTDSLFYFLGLRVASKPLAKTNIFVEARGSIIKVLYVFPRLSFSPRLDRKPS